MIGSLEMHFSKYSFRGRTLGLILLTILLLTTSNLFALRKKNYYATIKTTSGELVIRLYNQTPLHRDNFIKLAKDGFYNGIIFHRVIDNFMIQCGDPDTKLREKGKLYGNGGPGYNIPSEIVPGLYHKKGVVAAARMGDDVNPNRESSGSQFYIVKGKTFDDKTLDAAVERVNKRNSANNHNDVHTLNPEWREIYKTAGGTPHLDTQYTVFGEVIKGYEVVEMISVVKTDKNDRPEEDIVILSIRISKSYRLKNK